MSDPVDPMRTPGRWLVTTASGGAAYLIEATDPDSAVTATRVVAGPIGDDLRFPRAALRRDDQLAGDERAALERDDHVERDRRRARHVAVPRASGPGRGPDAAPDDSSSRRRGAPDGGFRSLTLTKTAARHP